MEVIIKPTAHEASLYAARMMASVVRRNCHATLGLATGSTPLGVYSELGRIHREEGLDFSGVTTFNLDEYVGIAPAHPASYHRYMEEHFLGQVNVPRSKMHLPDGMAVDFPACCAAYEAAIRATGGIDLQLLGLGQDGHIGFNEPGSSLASRTRLKTLTAKTLEANRPFFGPGENVPLHVITMGVGTIMEARTCLLLAFGEAKAEAVAGMVEGPITAMCPASILQMHPHVIVLVDESAARGLKRADYYRYVFANKPEFQREE